MRELAVEMLIEPFAELRDEFEGYPYEDEELVEEAEYESRDGFIPFTEGGAEARFFVNLWHMFGSGSFPSGPAGKKLEARIESDQDSASEEYADQHEKEITKAGFDPEDINNYHDLYEYYEKVGDEDILEWIDGYVMEDNEVMFHTQIFLYDEDSSDNPFDEGLGCLVQGAINWESPYFRYKYKDLYWDAKPNSFSFSNASQLKKKLKPAIKKVIDQLY